MGAVCPCERNEVARGNPSCTFACLAQHTSQNPICVYILTNQNRTVRYIGVANELARRVAEYKAGSYG